MASVIASMDRTLAFLTKVLSLEKTHQVQTRLKVHSSHHGDHGWTS